MLLIILSDDAENGGGLLESPSSFQLFEEGLSGERVDGLGSDGAVGGRLGVGVEVPLVEKNRALRLLFGKSVVILEVEIRDGNGRWLL